MLELFELCKMKRTGTSTNLTSLAGHIAGVVSNKKLKSSQS